jgi:hypothetical protein
VCVSDVCVYACACTQVGEKRLFHDAIDTGGSSWQDILVVRGTWETCLESMTDLSEFRNYGTRSSKTRDSRRQGEIAVVWVGSG